MASVVSAQAGTVGGTVALTGPGCLFPDIAYSPEEDCYLAVWVDYNNPGLPAVRGRFINATDDELLPQMPFAISDPADRGFYPSVTYNPTNREFLVTFDRENSQGLPPLSIRGRRVSATDGVVQGGVLPISTTINSQESAAAWSTNSLNYDKHVDQQDFGDLQACLSGNGQSYGSQCSDADLDADGDVDQDDSVGFQTCLGGSDSPPQC